MATHLFLACGQRFWRQLQRFAEYEDMKDLYGRVIPEIAKFESNVLNFQTENEKHYLIIRQFDETIAHKADKLLVEKMK